MVERACVERRNLTLLILIILLGCVLRMYRLGAHSLRGDEIATAVWGDYNLGEILKLEEQHITGDTLVSSAPLIYWVAHFSRGLGSSEFIVRLPAALAGILGVAVMYSVGKALIGSLEGLLGSFFLTISPFHIYHAQDARYYANMMLFSLLSLYFCWQASRRNGVRDWAGFVIVTVLNVYNHYFGLIVLASEIIWLVVQQAITRLGRVKSESTTQSQELVLHPPMARKFVALLLISLALIALLCLPKAPALWRLLREKQELQAGRFKAEIGLTYTLDFFSNLLWYFSAQSRLGLRLYVVLAAVGAFYVIRGREIRAGFLELVWFGAPFLILALAQPSFPLKPRFLIFMLPLYLLFVSRGLVESSKLVLWIARWNVNWSAATAGLAAILLAALALPSLADYYRREKQDWRGVAALLREQALPSEVIAVVTPYRLMNLQYYAPDLASYYVPEDAQDFQRLMSLYNGVWFVRTLSEREDYDPAIEQVVQTQSFVTRTFDGIWSPIHVSLWRSGLSAQDALKALSEGAR